MITIRDVALDAGVSTATVSRVLNNDAKVSFLMKKKVLAAIKKLNYNINTAARTLKSGESRIIGVIVPELSNLFFMPLFEYMEKVLQKQGYAMLLCSSGGTVEGELKRLNFLRQHSVDGIIVIPCTSHSEHFESVKDKVPFLFIDRGCSFFDVDTVLCDNEQASYDVVKVLIADGHKNIAFVGGDIGLQTCKERYKGFSRSMDDSKVPFHREMVVFTGMSFEGGLQAMDYFLSQKTQPDAYFFVNIMVCLGAAKRISEEPLDSQKKLLGQVLTMCIIRLW
ncbi:MAG: LacI family DNA-binding transcriptional regulator [Treponemataceae bacterium]